MIRVYADATVRHVIPHVLRHFFRPRASGSGLRAEVVELRSDALQPEHSPRWVDEVEVDGGQRVPAPQSARHIEQRDGLHHALTRTTVAPRTFPVSDAVFDQISVHRAVTFQLRVGRFRHFSLPRLISTTLSHRRPLLPQLFTMATET